jgi:Subtilisin-like serine proteases
MDNTVVAFTIFIVFIVNLLIISGNLAFVLGNDARIVVNNMNYTYSELIPQVITTGLLRIGGEGIETINDVDVDIAIMDVGIAPHRDLNLFHGFNAVNPGANYSVQCKHGTHVAGIAAAKNDEGGIVGTAPGARIWDIRISECDPTTGEPTQVAEYSLLNGLDYVLDHSDEIDVLNISYNEECPIQCDAQLYQDLIDDIVESGIVVVASAGNNHAVADEYVPPRLANVIPVSAISDSDGKCGGLGQPTSQGGDDTLASESNWGEGVDIAAPGIEILSTIPNDMYGTMSGTSMAAPYVSGTAALIIASNPNIEPDVVRNMILNAGSNPQTECDGDGHGYFDDFRDDLHEPLLYIKDLIPN